MTASSAPAPAPRHALLLIFLIAMAARIAAAALLPDQSALLLDATAFRKAAGSLIQTGLLHDPVRMPLYPALLVLTGTGKGQMLADILIASGAACLVYLLALRVLQDAWAALLAGFAAALYPPLVFFSVVGLSETLFLTLVLAAFLFWYRGDFVLAAIAAVLAILTRPVIDLAALFFVIYFTLAIHRLPLKAALRNVAIYAGVYVVLMTPWWIHNYKSYGTFVRFNLALGQVLYAGNNPMNVSGGGNADEDYSLKDFQHIKDPVALDKALREAALSFMVQNPARVAELALKKFERIWRPWPYHEGYSNPAYIAISVLSFVPVCLFALLYLARAGWRRLLLLSPLILFILYYTAIHMLLLGTIRFRLPFEPYLLIFAAGGFAWLVRRIVPRRFGGAAAI